MYVCLKMEMQETCGECQFNVWSEDHKHFCAARPDVRSFDGSAIWRVKHYPLIEVPEPHGRLIDADKLKETLDYYISEAGWSDEINKALSWVKDEFIDSEQTVIPASEEAE